ncbi:MAG: prephenate dehydrogenase [Nitrospirae bacterium]|nr:MAG: prephenate dehydrogenase [Nitrospirota bacterium]
MTSMASTRTGRRKTHSLPLFQQMTIAGVGLIGGSLGMICKQQGLVKTIVGAGRRVENLKRAVERKAIDRYVTDLAEAAAGSDLFVLATPVDTFEATLRACAPRLAPGAIVTDVGSVKGPLVERMEALVPAGIKVVGAHPVAGKEKTGVAAASSDLFRNALCILTPTSQTDPDALAKVRLLWEACGAHVHEMDPMVHDRVLGAISHLPHVLAFALVNTITMIRERHLPGLDLQSFAGGGYKDSTRIAASSPEMWRDICLWNRNNLLSQIELYEARLGHIKALLKAGDAEGLTREFTRAKQLREMIT